MAGRTLTQHAVPTTFGLKAAQWLAAVDDAGDGIAAVLEQLPGAVRRGRGHPRAAGRPGARRRPGRRRRAPSPDALGLRWPALPWHTRRAPVTRIGDALVDRDRRARGRWRPTCCCSAGPRSASCGRARRRGGAARRRCPTSATRCSRCWSAVAALQAPQLGRAAPPRLRDRRRRTARRRLARRVAGAAAAAGAGGDGGVAGRRAGRRAGGRPRRDGRRGPRARPTPARRARRRPATYATTSARPARSPTPCSNATTPGRPAVVDLAAHPAGRHRRGADAARCSDLPSAPTWRPSGARPHAGSAAGSRSSAGTCPATAGARPRPGRSPSPTSPTSSGPGPASWPPAGPRRTPVSRSGARSAS